MFVRQVCATVGTQHWVYNITNGTKPSNETLWIPWYIQDQLAGYQTILDSSFVSFVTVHHAGHEVPGYQPERALALYYGFLTGSIFNTSFAHSSEALFAVPEMSQSTSTQPLTSELWFWAAVGGGIDYTIMLFSTTRLLMVLSCRFVAGAGCLLAQQIFQGLIVSNSRSHSPCRCTRFSISIKW